MKIKKHSTIPIVAFRILIMESIAKMKNTDGAINAITFIDLQPTKDK